MRKHKLKLNGKWVTFKEWLRTGRIGKPGFAKSTQAYSDSKPLISDGAGCMTGQVEEMREAIKKRNIMGVRVRDNGQLEFTSRRGRREVLRMRGLCDADGGYGDG